ncbi:MAG: hypothetical protein EXR92_03255 [Gemmatimonadetes bacterium]|nr:hypothetical protein [Gemmatimonadota bacterium]
MAQGQEEIRAVMSGQLLVSGVPADSGTVVLHRVGAEEQREIDSTSVTRDGLFSFRLPSLPVPGTDAYFITTRYDGILYYRAPIGAPAQLDSLQVLEAFPTEPAPEAGISFPISLRQVTLEEGPRGWLVTDAFILTNNAKVTYVPAGDTAAVWQYPLPQGALGARIVQGEVLPGAGPVRFEGGRIVAANPIWPGPNFYLVQYDVESLDLDLQMPGEVALALLFLQESGPAIRVEGMSPIAPEGPEGDSYLRWVAEGIQDQVVRVRVGEEPGSRAVAWLSIVLAMLLVGAGVWGVTSSRMPSRGGPVPALAGGLRRWAEPERRLRKDILVEVARLDEDYAQAGEPDSEARSRHLRRRAELLDELAGLGSA